ncbi:asialoglycoprotein receptor 1-like [Chaetodon trifascialis]|uniref:asialoglycoprotein receptor 1-like n=1 Tax=Chaetodon trifascialis TaxID=109706 RepID=UPI00399183D7
MSEDLYAVPDLTKKVRFQTGEKEDGNADVGDINNVTIYDNCWAEGSTPSKPQDNTTDVQQQTSSVNVSSGNKNLFRAAAVLLGLLCLILLAAVIVLIALWIQQENIWKMKRNQLFVDNAKLTSERDELQTNYSEMESINHNLTHKTSQLENEKTLLNEMYTNLTNERDELQKEIEKTRCPANWIKFGSSCYSIPTKWKTWSDSKKSCEKHNAQLLIISSRMEQEFISLFELQVWIGLTRDHQSIEDWKWVNGTRLNNGYWRENQPDSKGPYDQRENCVEISSGHH